MPFELTSAEAHRLYKPIATELKLSIAAHKPFKYGNQTPQEIYAYIKDVVQPALDEVAKQEQPKRSMYGRRA